MNLKEWMDYREIRPEDGIAITLATTGLKPQKDYPTLLSLKGPNFFDNLYVHRAQPEEIEAAAPYSGITPAYHKARRMSEKAVIDQAVSRLKKPRFMITYRYSFTREWLKLHFEKIEAIHMLDIINYVKMLDRGETIPASLKTIWELNCALEDATRHIRGYSFQEVMQRFVPPVEFPEEMPLAERNTHNLYLLYQALLAA